MYIFALFAAIIVILILGCASRNRKLKKKAIKKVRTAKNKYIFNGYIRSVEIAYI